MAHYSSDTLPTCIEYHSADRYDTYTMYNPADVCWDVLNDIMSSYYLRYYQIFRLNGVAEAVYQVCVLHESVSVNVKTCHALPVMPVLLENRSLENICTWKSKIMGLFNVQIDHHTICVQNIYSSQMPYWLDIWYIGIKPRENPQFKMAKNGHLKTLEMIHFPHTDIGITC